MIHDRRIRPLTVSLALAAGVALGCKGSSDVALAPVQVRLSMADGIVASATAPLLSASVNGVLVSVSPDTVASLFVTISEIAFLPADAPDETDETEAAGPAWQTLTLDDPVTLDLMALPTAEEGEPIAIAAGKVLPGSYHKVRLLVSEGEIVFRGPLSHGNGNAASFEGGETYPVTIPSGAQTGLKTDVSFDVTDAGDGTGNTVDIVFVPGTTFQNVAVTGNGRIMLAPVLRAR
jgi:Domain of unknown function (DUF4382)